MKGLTDAQELAALCGEEIPTAEKRPLMGFALTAEERKRMSGLSEPALELLHGLCNSDLIYLSHGVSKKPSSLDELIRSGIKVIVHHPVDFGGAFLGHRVSLDPDIQIKI